jgi:hypothetical protein
MVGVTAVQASNGYGVSRVSDISITAIIAATMLLQIESVWVL